MTRWTAAALICLLIITVGCVIKPSDSTQTVAKPTGTSKQSSEEHAAVKQGGTLSLPLEISNDDPVLTGMDFSDHRLFALARAIGMPMIRVTPDGELLPGLAAEWSSDDGQVWKLSLDDRYADGGKLFTSHIRKLLKSGPAPLRDQIADLITGAADFRDGRSLDLSGITIDENVLTISLTRAYRIFPMWLSQPALYLYEGDNLENMRGLGPFTIGEIADNALRLVPSNSGIAGKPALDELWFILEPDRQKQAEYFENGALHAANIAIDEVPGIYEDSKLAASIHQLETAQQYTGCFNLSRFPWQDSKFQSKQGLRQAMNWGIHREDVRQMVHEQYQPWPYLLPKAMEDFIPPSLVSFPTYPAATRLEDARQALKEADHWGGSHLNRGMDLGYLSYENVGLLAKEILRYWEEISVNMQPFPMSLDELNDRVERHTHEIILARVSPAYPDPDAVIYGMLYSKFAGESGNWSTIAIDEIDEMLLESQATENTVVRQKLIQEILSELDEQAWFVFIGYSTPTVLIDPKVGCTLSPYDFDASLPAQDFSRLGFLAD